MIICIAQLDFMCILVCLLCFADNVIEECMHSDIIFSHPEALLMSDDGQGLLSALEGKVGVIVIDECHKVEDW